jgi:hypothetical protein
LPGDYGLQTLVSAETPVGRMISTEMRVVGVCSLNRNVTEILCAGASGGSETSHCSNGVPLYPYKIPRSV